MRAWVVGTAILILENSNFENTNQEEQRLPVAAAAERGHNAALMELRAVFLQW